MVNVQNIKKINRKKFFELKMLKKALHHMSILSNFQLPVSFGLINAAHYVKLAKTGFFT
jgi:hypothetical protein